MIHRSACLVHDCKIMLAHGDGVQGTSVYHAQQMAILYCQISTPKLGFFLISMFVVDVANNLAPGYEVLQGNKHPKTRLTPGFAASFGSFANTLCRLSLLPLGMPPPRVGV